MRLHGDFIDEVSMLYIDALTHDHFDPSKFVQIYATVAKLRLFASADVARDRTAFVSAAARSRGPNPASYPSATMSIGAHVELEMVLRLGRQEAIPYRHDHHRATKLLVAQIRKRPIDRCRSWFRPSNAPAI